MHQEHHPRRSRSGQRDSYQIPSDSSEEESNNSSLLIQGPEVLSLDSGSSDHLDVSKNLLPDNFTVSDIGLVVPVTGQILLPEKDAPVEIKLPGKDEVATYTRENNTDRARERAQEQARILIHFKTKPWHYLGNKLKVAGLQSPANEIVDQIESYREQKAGISQEIPDIAIINVSALSFIRGKFREDSQEESEFKQFSDVIGQVVDDIFLQDGNPQERMKLLVDVCQHLDVLIQAFLYRNNEYKVNDPELLDFIAQKVEWLFLADKSELAGIRHKQLRVLFDFLSFFEMNSQVAGELFLDIMNKFGLNHPLRYEIEWRMQRTKGSLPESDIQAPKIGIEIEGVPLVVCGYIPEGFELGIDGGYEMPEFRRKNGAYLPFNIDYRKQLYDLWYWAKMSQLKGASLHIHLDDVNDTLRSLFEKIFGSGSESVDVNFDYKTVEIRLNLTSYRVHGSEAYNDLSVPFFHEQFDIVPLIDFLIACASSHGKDEETFKRLSPFWKKAIEKRAENPLSFSEVFGLLEQKQEQQRNVGVGVYGLVRKLEKPITFAQFKKIVDSFKNAYTNKAFLSAIEPLHTFEDVKSFLDLLEAYSVDSSDDYIRNCVVILLSKLQVDLTLDQVTYLFDRYEFEMRFPNLITSNYLEVLPKKLDSEEALELIKDKGKDYSDLLPFLVQEPLTFSQFMRYHKATIEKGYELSAKEALVNLDRIQGPVSYQELISAFDMLDQNTDILRLGIPILTENLTWNQVEHILSLADVLENTNPIFFECIKKYDQKITFSQLKEKLNFYDNYLLVSADVLRRIKGGMTFSAFWLLLLKIDLEDEDSVDACLSLYSQNFSLDEIIFLIENIRHGNYARLSFIHRINTTEVPFEQLLEKIYDMGVDGVWAAIEHYFRHSLNPELIVKILARYTSLIRNKSGLLYLFAKLQEIDLGRIVTFNEIVTAMDAYSDNALNQSNME